MLNSTRILAAAFALAALSGSGLAQDENSIAARKGVEKELASLASTLEASAGAQAIDLARTEEFTRIRATEGHLEALHEIMSALFDDERIRLVAMEVVAAIGDPASVYPVLLILNDSNERPVVRMKAIDVAVRFGDSRAVMPLADLIGLEEEKTTAGDRPIEFERWLDVKRRAAEAIAKLAPPDVAVDRLVGYLTEKIATPSTVECAAYALGLLGAERAVPDLRRLLRLEGLEPGIRRETLLALGRIGDAEALPDLEAGLADPDSAVQMEVVNALAFMGAKAEKLVPKLLAMLRDDAADLYVRASVPGALVHIAPASAEALGALASMLGRKIEGLPDYEDPMLLHVACKVALRYATPARAVPILLERAGDTDPAVREAVQDALAHVTHPAFEGNEQKIPQSPADWQEWWGSAGKAFFQR